MREKVELIVAEARKIADVINSFPGEIKLISHFDCDGICSAAIFVRALGREGKQFHLSFVKKLDDHALEELMSDQRKLFLFTDLGSGKLESIQEKLPDGRKAIIIDHHQIQGMVFPANRDRLFHLNPVQFGVDENISGSGVSYLVARAMSPINRDLSELAIVGALGDSQMGSIGPDWGVLGLNKEILRDAEEAGKIRIEKGLRLWGRYTRPLHKALEYCDDPKIPGISGSESACIQFLHDMGIPPKTGDKWRTLADLSEEEAQKLAGGIIKERVTHGEDNPEWIFGDNYELLDKQEEFRDANEFATIINACGKLDRMDLALSMCFNDFSVADDVRKVLTSYRREIGKSISVFEKNRDIIQEKEHGTYALVGGMISENVISNALSVVSRSGLVREKKPVFAFVDTEDGESKISARLIGLEEPAYGLNEVIATVATELGGEGGGHRFAAGASIPKGSEQMFINRMEEILKQFNGHAPDNEEAAKPQKGETLNNRDTEIVKSEVKVGGRKADEQAEESGLTDRYKKMEGKGLVRYFNA